MDLGLLDPINWTRKQWTTLIIGFFVAVVAILGYRFYKNQNPIVVDNFPPSHQFIGRIERVFGPTTLLVKGVHIPDDISNKVGYENIGFVDLVLSPNIKYSGGFNNVAGLKVGTWIDIKTSNDSSDENTLTVSVVSKATEYSLSGKVMEVSNGLINISTTRVVSGDSGSYTQLDSKQIIVTVDTPVITLSLKDNKITQIKGSAKDIKVGDNISVLTNFPPDFLTQLIPLSIQISQ